MATRISAQRTRILTMDRMVNGTLVVVVCELYLSGSIRVDGGYDIETKRIERGREVWM